MLTQLQFNLLEQLCDLRPVDEESTHRFISRRGSSSDCGSDRRTHDEPKPYKNLCEYTLSKESS